MCPDYPTWPLYGSRTQSDILLLERKVGRHKLRRSSSKKAKLNPLSFMLMPTD